MNKIINHVLSLLSYLLSLPLLGYGVWLLCTKVFECEDYLPTLGHFRTLCGVGLISVFALGCLFTHLGGRFLLPGAVTLATLTIGMLILGIALSGSYPMETRGIPGSPEWIRSRIAVSHPWTSIKNCIYESEVCQVLSFATAGLSSDDFYKKDLSPIESGCCKPPDLCGMEYVNATYWTRPVATANGTTSPTNSTVNPNTFGDCLAFNNKITLLCYDCQSCKEGFLKSTRHHWKKLGAFFIAMSVLLLTVHTVRFVVTMMDNKI